MIVISRVGYLDCKALDDLLEGGDVVVGLELKSE